MVDAFTMTSLWSKCTSRLATQSLELLLSSLGPWMVLLNWSFKDIWFCCTEWLWMCRQWGQENLGSRPSHPALNDWRQCLKTLAGWVSSPGVMLRLCVAFWTSCWVQSWGEAWKWCVVLFHIWLRWQETQRRRSWRALWMGWRNYHATSTLGFYTGGITSSVLVFTDAAYEAGVASWGSVLSLDRWPFRNDGCLAFFLSGWSSIGRRLWATRFSPKPSLVQHFLQEETSPSCLRNAEWCSILTLKPHGFRLSNLQALHLPWCDLHSCFISVVTLILLCVGSNVLLQQLTLLICPAGIVGVKLQTC